MIPKNFAPPKWLIHLWSIEVGSEKEHWVETRVCKRRLLKTHDQLLEFVLLINWTQLLKNQEQVQNERNPIISTSLLSPNIRDVIK